MWTYMQYIYTHTHEHEKRRTDGRVHVRRKRPARAVGFMGGLAERYVERGTRCRENDELLTATANYTTHMIRA